MPEISVNGAGVVTVIGEFIAACMPEHMSMRLDAQTGRDGCRSIMREPGADSGAPRSGQIRLKIAHSPVDASKLAHFTPAQTLLAPAKFISLVTRSAGLLP